MSSLIDAHTKPVDQLATQPAREEGDPGAHEGKDEGECLRSDGSVFPLDLSVSEFRADGRRMFTGILHDITKRRRLEREILEASANEQRRIGHELHGTHLQRVLDAISRFVDTA